jgi:hypothetical protein
MNQHQAAVEQALRDVRTEIRNAAEPDTVATDLRYGAGPTLIPGKTRETPELREARAKLDAAVRAYGEALVAKETPT